MHTVCHSILFSNFLIPKLNGVVHKTVWRVTNTPLSNYFDIMVKYCGVTYRCPYNSKYYVAFYDFCTRILFQKSYPVSKTIRIRENYFSIFYIFRTDDGETFERRWWGIMRTVCNFYCNFSQSHPLPAFRNLKWFFFVRNRRQGLLFFELAFLHQSLFFCMDTFQENGCGLVGGILWDKAAFDGLLENGVTQLLGVHHLFSSKPRMWASFWSMAALRAARRS